MRKTCSAREMAALAGGIISMSRVHVAITSLYTRNMYQFISLQSKWDTVTKIPSTAKSELRFWDKNLSTLNNRYFSISTIPAQAIAQSDASNAACGANLKLNGKICGMKKTFVYIIFCILRIGVLKGYNKRSFRVISPKVIKRGCITDNI